jgi:hypothetical protein
MKRLDLTGQKRGRLMALSYSHSHIPPSGQKRAIWNVICDCGKKLQVATNNFLRNVEPSCGCRKLEVLLQGIKPKNPLRKIKNLFHGYKIRAKKNKISFEFSFDDFVNLVSQNCFYCGRNPKLKFKYLYRTKTSDYNGIDRKNYKEGYIKNNCVPCCSTCNMMKNTLSVDEFLNHIDLIFNFRSIKSATYT